MNKSIKKMLAGVASAAAVCAMIAPAANAADSQTGTTQLNATVPSSTYVLHVPADTTVTQSGRTDLASSLYVTGTLRSNESVAVTTGDPTSLTLESDTTKTLAYNVLIKDTNTSIFGQSMVWSSTDVVTDKSGEGGKTVQLQANIGAANWDNASAGTYKGSITFIAKLQ